MYIDHEALRSLLNATHPLGKLARWGLALQELELQIQYCPGNAMPMLMFIPVTPLV